MIDITKKELKEIIQGLRDLIIQYDKVQDKEETIVYLENLDGEELKAGKVSWTRLYDYDDDVLAKLSIITKRKKSQIIRMLVHAGLSKGIIEEFTIR